MRKVGLAVWVVAAILGGLVFAADEVSSVNVVGFYKLAVSPGDSGDTFTFMSAPFTKIPAARGVIAGNTNDVIYAEGAAWTPGQFAENSDVYDEPGLSTFFLEVSAPTTSAYIGTHYYISNNDASSVTLKTDPGIANDALAGASFKIVAGNRIRDIFGEPPNPVLKGGASLAVADNILLWTGAGWSTPIWYKNTVGAPGKNVWVKDDALANDLPIDRDEGFAVLRRNGGVATNLCVMGEVSKNPQAVLLGSGFSLLGGMSAVDIAIGDSDLEKSVGGGASVAVADNVIAWTGSGWSNPVWYKTTVGAPGKNIWVQDSVDVSDTFILKAGQGFFILTRTDRDNWDRKSPLQ